MIDIPWMACLIPLLTILLERERERERERLASVARSLLCHVMLMIIIVYIVSSECYFGSMCWVLRL